MLDAGQWDDAQAVWVDVRAAYFDLLKLFRTWVACLQEFILTSYGRDALADASHLDAVVAGMPQIARAQCLMASRIGAPVNAPALLQVLVETHDGMPVESLRGGVEAIVGDHLARLPQLLDDFVAGTVRLY